jgi:ribosomal-protein-alanine N-acetyltransferase
LSQSALRRAKISAVQKDDSPLSPRPAALTARLRLEPIRRDRADDLWRLHHDEGVAAYWGAWSHEDANRFALACEEAWTSQGVSKWIAYDRIDSTLVGRGGLSRIVVDGELRLEVGWTVREALRGRGFATEIGQAGLLFAFDELGADEVVAFTEPANLRSRAVMERLGMTYEYEITHNGAPFVLYIVRRARR